LKYSEEVNIHEKYIEAKKQAEEIINELSPYLNCATQYGNFFQFNSIFLDKITCMPFLTEEIKFRVSNEIIPNLRKPLYGQNPECGLREIIQNACDASKELIKIKEWSVNDAKELKVKVSIIEVDGKKKICIRDYGIGMTKDILLDKYFVIGESSKKNSELNLVGQFGIGALAAFLLGDNIEVKTKHYKEGKVYHFFYDLESNKYSYINVSIEEDDCFLHGTEVTISLNDTLTEASNQRLTEILKLNSWYIKPDIPIEYYIEDVKQDMNTLTGDKYHWIELNTSIDTLHACYLDDYFGSQIILNGLIIPERYQFTCKYLKKNPYISIISYGNEITLNLERSKVESGLSLILKPLQDTLIRKELDKLKCDKEQIVDKNLTIKCWEWGGKYLKNLPLVFCREGFGIYSCATIKNIKYNAIVRIFGYNGYPYIKLSDLQEGLLYVFYDDTLNKADIAKLIESCDFIYVPTEIIKKYFYEATSQYNGFKGSTMEKLYSALKKPIPTFGNVNQFWQKHNEVKEKLFVNDFIKPGYISIKDNYADVVSNVSKLCHTSIIDIIPVGFYPSDIIMDNIDIGILE
jgi:hypothetical protein